MKSHSHNPEDNPEEVKPCPVCMAPNEVDAIECSKCGAIFGVPSVLNPGVVITAYGPVWRSNWKLGRPRKVIVSSREAWGQLGIDLIVCIPLLAVGSVTGYFGAIHRQGFWDYASLWFGIACVVWCVSELYWSTEMVIDARLKERRHGHRP
ncbi:MAG: hypothetical protein ACJ73D_08175 [Pyrinomonadaceae bacterium]